MESHLAGSLKKIHGLFEHVLNSYERCIFAKPKTRCSGLF